MTFISTGSSSNRELGGLDFGAVACNLCRKTVPHPDGSEGPVWVETGELFELTEDWTTFDDKDIHICPDHTCPDVAANPAGLKRLAQI